MLTNRFTLAVRVSRQKYPPRCLGSGSEFLDDFFFTRDDVVNRFEVMVDVHTKLALRQVFHMAQ